MVDVSLLVKQSNVFRDVVAMVLNPYGLLPFCLSKKVTEKGRGNRNPRNQAAHAQAVDFGREESAVDER